MKIIYTGVVVGGVEGEKFSTFSVLWDDQARTSDAYIVRATVVQGARESTVQVKNLKQSQVFVELEKIRLSVESPDPIPF